MPGGAAGGGGDRCGGADLGEGSFALEPFDVLACGDQELAGVGDADAEPAGRAGGRGADEPLALWTGSWFWRGVTGSGLARPAPPQRRPGGGGRAAGGSRSSSSSSSVI